MTPSSEHGAGPLRIGGVPEHFNLPWHLALDGSALTDLAFIWEDQPGGTGQMLAKLESGELDVVSILTEGTVSAIDRGLPLTMVQVYVSSPLQWGIFVPPSADVRTTDELEGSRVAISRFSSGSHLMAFILAQQNGWSLTEDQFVEVGGLDGAVEAFAGRRADLFLWERHMTRPLVESGDFRQVGVLETPWPSFVIAVRDEVLAGRTTEVGRLVDAVTAEATALHGRPDIADLIADRYRLMPETAQSWLDSTTFVPRSAMDQTIAETVLKTLANAGFS